LNKEFSIEHVFDGWREDADALIGMNAEILAFKDKHAQAKPLLFCAPQQLDGAGRAARPSADNDDGGIIVQAAIIHS
jgi:hypothetical protein